MGTLKRDESRLARLVENLSRLVAREPRPVPRSRAPGSSLTACLNHVCWSEVWLGTMSTITLMSRACASSISAWASPSVPNMGSTPW